MRVTAITTVGHNVGDDFVREGILYLLGQVAPDIRLLQVHKHLPITARPGWDWFHRNGAGRFFDRIPGLSGLRVAAPLDRVLPLDRRTDKILNCDLLVQCGAPVYWLHGANSCDRNEWYGPLIRRRWSLVRDRVPFLSLAGGSCQDYNSDGTEFEHAGKTVDYIREFHDDCRLTTLRDPLAGKILRIAGRNAPVLPCTSIFARFRLGLEPQEPKFVALNYMRAGGHYRFSKGPGPEVWERIFHSFVKQLPPGEDYVFICHNRAELQEVRRLFPTFKTFWSEDYRDYLQFFAGAKYGIFNRVHAAFALASFGRPSFVIGSDSRARMSEMIGLKSAFVDEVTPSMLLGELERLGHSWNDYKSELAAIQAGAEGAYLGLLRKLRLDPNIES